MLFYLAILTLVASTDLRGVKAADWSYEGKYGPDKWPGLCQTGKYQSPIDIVTDSAIKKDLGDLKFVRYDVPYSGTVTNNGHTIQVQLANTSSIQLQSEYLSSKYSLEQLHFHWGAEHTVDSFRYSLELHFVHYDQRYENVNAASQYKDGVAVIATFFQLGTKDNEALKPILKEAELVAPWVGGSIRPLRDKFTPSLLLPKYNATYYTYEGSLTTPNCQEAVVWFVIPEPFPISETQLKVFHNVSTNEGILKSNYRPIQTIGDRQIYRHLSGYSSSRSNFSVHIYLGLLCMFLTRLS